MELDAAHAETHHAASREVHLRRHDVGLADVQLAVGAGHAADAHQAARHGALELGAPHAARPRGAQTLALELLQHGHLLEACALVVLKHLQGVELGAVMAEALHRPVREAHLHGAEVDGAGAHAQQARGLRAPHHPARQRGRLSRLQHGAWGGRRLPRRRLPTRRLLRIYGHSNHGRAVPPPVLQLPVVVRGRAAVAELAPHHALVPRRKLLARLGLEVELQHDGDQDAARKVQEQVAGAAEEGGVAREVHDVAERAELHHGEDTEALRGEAPARLERAQQLHSKEAAPRPARGESFAAERLRE
mmetsp:Transcript_9112/g.17124  ORF Transcript_9112/g.17124 Transcript_9112/m.17124 type:complete len:304 (+) Transcript_9112:3227-4138(+)